MWTDCPVEPEQALRWHYRRLDAALDRIKMRRFESHVLFAVAVALLVARMAFTETGAALVHATDTAWLLGLSLGHLSQRAEADAKKHSAAVIVLHQRLAEGRSEP